MSSYPSCFGNYKGKDGDLDGEPVGECRRCQPFRKCRARTKDDFILGFRAKIEEGEKPSCYGHPRSMPAWICVICPLKANLGCETEAQRRGYNKRMLAVMKVAEKEAEEEAVFLERLHRKVKSQWGGQDGAE